MSRIDKIDALNKLQIVIDDCQAQINSLKLNDDVDWHCYTIDNWENMIYFLDQVKTYIKLKEGY